MSNQKDSKTILIFNEYYLPGYKAGGPIRSISNLVSWLGDELNFKIITTDRDSFEEEPYKNIKVNEWNKVGKAEVYYIKKEEISISHLNNLLQNTSYDAVYLNSLWGIYFSFIPLLLLTYFLKFDYSKILLAPRGQLSDGALDQKTFKKMLFLQLLNLLNVYRRINWQATNTEEKKEIKKRINVPSDQIHNVTNLPQKISNEEFKCVGKEVGSLNIVYLSRVTPKKNLDFALDILSEIKNVVVNLDIYGIVDDQKYWKKCQNKIKKLPVNVTVNYKGIVEHEKVTSTISMYHLFLLPTKGENFGHAIYEAMLSGTPVLISDQTPWKNLVKKDMGWDISLEKKNKFVHVIRKLAGMDRGQLNERKREVKKAIFNYNIEDTLRNTQRLFSSLSE